MLQKFTSLIEFQKAFSTERKCIKHLEQLRWGGVLTCPRCKKSDMAYTYKKVGLYGCGHCRREFSVRKGTIFEDSKLPLEKWFLAFYLETAHAKGVSSCQLAKDIKVHQETAWFVLQRIRWALEHKTIEKLDSDVEVDETYLGGKEKNKHANKKKPKGPLVGESKMVVLGMVQRKGRAILRFISKSNIANIKPLLEEHIDFDKVNLYTDESPIYKVYKREVVCHSKGEYSRGKASTNSIEGIFGLFKRRIYGIHHQITEQHLGKYINSFCFRLSHRNASSYDRFNLALGLMFGKRLTYRELAGAR